MIVWYNPNGPMPLRILACHMLPLPSHQRLTGAPRVVAEVPWGSGACSRNWRMFAGQLVWSGLGAGPGSRLAGRAAPGTAPGRGLRGGGRGSRSQTATSGNSRKRGQAGGAVGRRTSSSIIGITASAPVGSSGADSGENRISDQVDHAYVAGRNGSSGVVVGIVNALVPARGDDSGPPWGVKGHSSSGSVDARASGVSSRCGRAGNGGRDGGVGTSGTLRGASSIRATRIGTTVGSRAVGR